MSKIKMLGAAFVAVLAFSAVATASALASHHWENISTKAEVVKEEAATTKGTLILHHVEIPALFGGGHILVECKGSFIGTVGAAGADRTNEVKGEKGENTKLDCKVIETTNTICKTNGALVLVTAVNLNPQTAGAFWSTQLEEELGNIYDKISKGNSGEPGYETECSGLSIKCEGADRSRFIKNEPAGAKFEFLGELKVNCTDGGKGTTLGNGIVEGYNVV